MSSNISITRICQHCGNEFTAKTTVTKFCGDACAKRNYKFRRKTAKQQKMNEKITESNRQTQLVRDAPKMRLLEKEFLTVKEAAIILGCSDRAIHLMISSGRLPAINLGVRKTRILRSELQRLFELPELRVKPVAKVKLVEEPLTKENCYTVEQITKSWGVPEIQSTASSTERRYLNFKRARRFTFPKSISRRHTV